MWRIMTNQKKLILKIVHVDFKYFDLNNVLIDEKSYESYLSL